MPKPIIRTMQQNQTKTNSILSASNDHSTQQHEKEMGKMKLNRLLRQPRSKEYMDAIHKLDAGGHAHDQAKVNDIINTIKSELPEIELIGILLGYVSVCYLGKPYEVHTLDITGKIIEHYKSGQALPNGLEKARGIALRGGYDFIEVYVDCCRAISANGSVSVISC